MNLSFDEPIRTAWQRMVRTLFRPFSLQRWLVLGFAAFLSEGLSHGLGGRGAGFRQRTGGGAPDISGAVQRAAEFFRHPVWGALLLVVITLACIAFLVLLWVNCRGRFIFLENVVRERPAIVEPWRRFARRGNELFVFTALSSLLWISVLVAAVLPILPAVLAAASSGRWRDLLLIAMGGWLLYFTPLLLLMSVFYLFLTSFVVPIMYRDDIGPLAAWGRFFGLFARHPLHFVGFALMMLVLSVMVFVAVMAAGFGTCCIGFLLLATPYVGSVALLPVEFFFRGLGPDFLAQFGPEYSVYAPPAPGGAAS